MRRSTIVQLMAARKEAWRRPSSSLAPAGGPLPRPRDEPLDEVRRPRELGAPVGARDPHDPGPREEPYELGRARATPGARVELARAHEGDPLVVRVVLDEERFVEDDTDPIRAIGELAQ